MAKAKLSTYILLDRSGSMSGAKWENAISSINEYVAGLQKDKDITGDVTVAAFDSNYGGWSGGVARTPNFNNAFVTQERPTSGMEFKVLRENQALTKFKKLTTSEVEPRGGTPLYDATGVLLNMAENEPNEKTIILIMTDGQENESRVYNLQSIKDRLKGATNRGWEVVFLGAEFNADNMTRDFGIGLNKVVNNSRSVDLNDTMMFYSSSASAYAKTGASIDTSEMRAKYDNK